MVILLENTSDGELKMMEARVGKCLVGCGEGVLWEGYSYTLNKKDESNPDSGSSFTPKR